MITVPVSASMYQSMMANIQQIHTNSDGTVCITPMQVDAPNSNNTSSSSDNNNSNSINGGAGAASTTNGGANTNTEANSNASAAQPSQQYQCYSIMAATPIATAAHRLLANTALSQTQHSLVHSLNLNSLNNAATAANSGSNMNSSDNNSNSCSNTNPNTSSTNNNNNNNNDNLNCNNNSNNGNNIRYQIINASSLLAPTNSSQQHHQHQHQHQHQQHHQQHQQHLQALINQQNLTNVLQNAGAKVFIATNPVTHLNLTAAAASNLLNSNSNNNNNNNNDATVANNNNVMMNAATSSNNNNGGHIKIATALPIVVATANPHLQHQHPTAAIIATTAASGSASGGVLVGGKHRRNRSSFHNTNNHIKSGHKRRKHSFAKVLPIKTEDGGVDTSSLIQQHNGDIARDVNHETEGLLNIQIVGSSSDNQGDNSNVNGGNDGSADGAAGGGIVGVCNVGSVRVGNRLVSVDVSKTIKLESIDN